MQYQDQIPYPTYYTPPCMMQHQYMTQQPMQGIMPDQNIMQQNMPELMPQWQSMPSQVAPGMMGHDIYTYPQNLPMALQLIREAVAGESEDRKFYEYLISIAPAEEDKNIIRGIRDNEMTHFTLFRQIFYEITGRMLPPPPEAEFEKPATYCDGLQKALLGEQNAVIKYRKILFAMQDRVNINKLTEIITDEIRHGILYNYLYSKNNCNV